MFDYRYHALSLAAVLFALTLGVLIGVAIGDSNLVSSAKNGIVANLKSEVSHANHEVALLQGSLGQQEEFATSLYPLAVHELLTARNIGVIFLGGSSDKVNGLVHAAVTEAGANVATVVAVREPLELSGIDHEAAGTHYSQLAESTELLNRFGQLAGRQFVSGGALVDRELLSRVRASLFSAFDGQLTRLEGLVVMRNEPTTMSAVESEASAAFDAGLISGASAAGVPTVGVELTSTEPSQIPWYKGNNISSVDNLNQLAGQAALAYALAGSRGTFGVKPTADSLLPTVAETTTQP